MKKTFLIFGILLFSVINSFSQTFEYIHPKAELIYGNILEISNNQYAVLMIDSFFIFSNQGEIISKKKIKESDYIIRYFFKTSDNKYISVGYNDYVQGTNYSHKIVKYDENFNKIWEKEHNVNLHEGEDIKYYYSATLNSNDEVIVCLTTAIQVAPDETQIFHFSEEGNFLQQIIYDEFCIAGNEITVSPDQESYLIAGKGYEGFDLLVLTDSNFNIKAIKNTNNINNYISGIPFVNYLTDSTFLYSEDIYDGSNAMVGTTKLDTSFNILAENMIGMSVADYENNIARSQAVDFIDTSNFFVGGTLYASNWYWGDFFILAKYDFNLNIIWEKFYGKEETFRILTNVYATTDGGCIMHGLYVKEFQSSIIIKVDENGNGPGTSINGEPIKVSELIVYPNPGKTQLTIRTAVQRLGGRFVLHDISGRQVLQKNISQSITNVNTQNLQSGVYIYNYLFEDKVIETGKWIKE